MRFGASSSKWLQTLAVAIVAAPSTALALFIWRFGVNVIITDEWSMVPLYEEMVRGNMRLSDLFAAWNGHRIFFPRLVMLALERLSAFDVVWEMYLSWLLLTATVILIFCMYLRVNRPCGLRVIAYFLPISLLMFSFRQEESILTGFDCSIYFAVFCVVVAIFLLDRAATRFFLLLPSILAGIVASYSFLLGLIVWPAGVAQIALSFDSLADRVKRLLLWTLSGAVVSSLYAADFRIFNAAMISQSRIRTAEYVLTYIGAPFTFQLAYLSASIAIVLAIIAAFTFFQAWKGGVLKENSVWFSLIIFAVLSAAVSAVGRSEFGVAEALSSRYTPVSVLGVVGLYSIALSAAKRYSGIGRRFTVHALLTLMLLALVVSTGAGWHIGQQTRLERILAVGVLQNFQKEPDGAISRYLTPNASDVREWAPYLQANGLNVFARRSENATSEPSMTTWRIKDLNEQITMASKLPLRVLCVLGVCMWANRWQLISYRGLQVAFDNSNMHNTVS